MTVRGEIVALLVPVARRRTRGRRDAPVWTDIDRLAREVTARWPRRVGAAEAVGRNGVADAVAEQLERGASVIPVQRPR